MGERIIRAIEQICPAFLPTRAAIASEQPPLLTGLSEAQGALYALLGDLLPWRLESLSDALGGARSDVACTAISALAKTLNVALHGHGWRCVALPDVRRSLRLEVELAA